MSGLIGLHFTDIPNEVGIPQVIQMETKELEILKNGDCQKFERIHFPNDFTETTERVEAGKDSKKKTVEDFKPKPAPFIQRAITGTVSTIVCAYNKLAICTGCRIFPPLHIIDSVAFYPPAPWKWYYLSYYCTEKEKRCFGNAQQCYGKPNIRIEPVTNSKDLGLVSQIESFAERTEAFIVQSDSGNFIVGAKIEAELMDDQKPSNKVILLANSNACDMGLTLNCYAGYVATYQHPDAYDVYLFDYSGYGLSTEKATETAVYKDIEAIYEYIVAERKDPNLEITLLGISIGTAVVTDLAAKNLPFVVGVILVAPLTSGIRHAARNNHPKKTSPHVDCFRILDKVSSVKVTLLCCHGLNDEMMPPSNSAEIYAAAPFGVDPLFIANRSHLGILSSFRLGQRVRTFIEEDIEKCESGIGKNSLRRTKHMKYEEFEHDKDTESNQSVNDSNKKDKVNSIRQAILKSQRINFNFSSKIGILILLLLFSIVSFVDAKEYEVKCPKFELPLEECSGRFKADQSDENSTVLILYSEKDKLPYSFILKLFEIAFSMVFGCAIEHYGLSEFTTTLITVSGISCLTDFANGIAYFISTDIFAAYCNVIYAVLFIVWICLCIWSNTFYALMFFLSSAIFCISTQMVLWYPQQNTTAEVADYFAGAIGIFFLTVLTVYFARKEKYTLLFERKNNEGRIISFYHNKNPAKSYVQLRNGDVSHKLRRITYQLSKEKVFKLDFVLPGNRFFGFDCENQRKFKLIVNQIEVFQSLRYR